MKKYEGYALVTGASSGIGSDFAMQLAAAGYDLVLVARNEPRLKKVAADIKKEHAVDIIIIVQDLSKPESTDIIFDTLTEKKIHVGLLVNNAGFTTFGSFHETPRDKSLEMINVMCTSYMDLTYKFLSPMLEKGSGGVIFISGVPGILTAPLIAVYGAAKVFTLQLGINLHAEYAKKGIDVLTVCPGLVDTNFLKTANAPLPKAPFLHPTHVAEKSLAALGKDIVLTLPSDTGVKMGLFLTRFLSYKMSEKITAKVYKQMWDIDLDV